MWPFRRKHSEIDEEIRAHLAMAERDLVDRGAPATDARTRARREFGNVLAVREVTGDADGWPALGRFAQDVRHAIRRLRQSPATVVGAVVLLGLAVGVTTAMFTVVDALLLRPLPFRDPERLLNVYMGTKSGGTSGVAPAVLRAWRESSAFDAAEAANRTTSILDTPDGPLVRDVASVSPGLFDMLGVRPIRGRLFDPEDGRGGMIPRVVIAEDLWRGPLGADPGVVGRTITIDSQPVEVVGVLPSDFRFPSSSIQVWRATDFESQPPGQNLRPAPYLRVAKNMSLAEALTIATDRAHIADPSTQSLQAFAVPNRYNVYFERAVKLLAGGVLLVFLVLAANVSGLLLARLNARRREFSLCAALGASRGRLIRQALAENTVIAALGGAAGVALAWMLVSAARAGLPPAVFTRSLNPLDLDLRALAAAFAATTLATLVASLLPAILATRVSPASVQGVGDRARTEARGARTFTRILLVGEIALACTLLIGGALLVRSFLNLTSADRGFDPRGLVEFGIDINRRMMPTAPARAAIFETVRAGLSELPGVLDVVAWGGCGLHFGTWHSDVPGVPPFDANVDERCVDANFFKMYGVRLLRGRQFEPADPDTAAIVGERMAAALWPGLDPIGRSLTFDKQRFSVTGVVTEMNRPSLDSDQDYADLYTRLTGGGTITLRCAATCPTEGTIRQRIRAMSAAAQPFAIRFLEQVYADDLAQPRATAAVAVTFGAIALLAVAGGLFSVLSYAVSRRRREFGVRAALGASPAQLRWVVLADGLTVAGLGIALGAAAGWLLMRLLSSLQYGVSASDPLSWTLVVATLVATVLAAAWRPARQAMRVDPAILLRDE